MNITPLLAVDPALPQRDLLLDETVMTEYLSRMVEHRIEDCERLRTKYRVGTSLRVLYELRSSGRSYRIAARAFPRTHQVSFWIFPHDRKIKNLAVLGNIPDELRNIEGRTWTGSRIVAHAPEKSVTAQCLDENEQVIAYAKIYAGDEGRQIFETYKAAIRDVQVPRAIAYSGRHQLLLLESVAGVPLSTVAESEDAFFRLGSALRSLHRINPPSSLPRATRLTPETLALASASLIQARPDVADLVQQLSAKLNAQYTHGKPVFLHGDVHPKNIFLNEENLFLLDLDQVAIGTAAADLGSVIAGLYCDACTGSRTWSEARSSKHALLTGYGAPHDSHELRWHIAAALLQERALRSVTRIRTVTLQKLPEILHTAQAVLNGGDSEN